MTQKYKHNKRTFFWLSFLSWFGYLGGLIIWGVTSGLTAGSGGLAAALLDVFMPLAITYLVAIALVIFIREKFRNTIWVTNIALSALFLPDVWLWISIGLFAVDEFLLNRLYLHYKNKETISKEIDKRL